MSDIHHVTSWPGILGICESVTLHVFPFIVPWLKRTVGERLKRGARMGRERAELWNPGEEKLFSQVSVRVCGCYLGAVLIEELWNGKHSDLNREMTSERKWSPAVALHERNPHSPLNQCVLTFTALVSYCDKHAIDVISVIPRFYNRFGLIVIILWVTVWVLSEWCPLSLDSEGCDLESRVVELQQQNSRSANGKFPP